MGALAFLVGCAAATGEDATALGTRSLDAGLDAAVDAAEPPDASRPPVPQAPADGPAMRACELIAQPAAVVALASDVSGAARVVLTADARRAVQLQVPAGGVGFGTVQITAWHEPIAAFVGAASAAAFPRADTRRGALGNGACPDALTDMRLLFHEWGAYTFRVEGEPGTLVPFVLLRDR